MLFNNKSVTLFFLLIGICVSNACLHGEELDLRKQKQKVLKANFSSDGTCITSSVNYESVDKELEGLVKAYPYDLDLQLNYKDFLLKKSGYIEKPHVPNKDEIKAVKIWAKVILSYDRNKLPNNMIENFLKALSFTTFYFEGIPFQLPFVNLYEYIYINNGVINKKESEKFNEGVKSIFSVFRKEFIICDAFIHILNGNQSREVRDFLTNLYNFGIYKSPYLTLCYGCKNLLRNNQYKEIIKEFTPLLVENIEDILYNYDSQKALYFLLGISTYQENQLNKSKKYFENILDYENDAITLLTLADIALKEKDYTQTVKWLEQLQKFSIEELKEEKINLDWVKKTYIAVLNESGQAEKAKQIMLDYTQETIKSQPAKKKKKKGLHSEIIQIIKENQEALEVSEQQKKEEKLVEKKNKGKQTAHPDLVLEQNDLDYFVSYKKEKYVIPEIKEKAKSHGQPFTPTPTPIEEVKVEKIKLIPIEEILNPKGYKIFCKFFNKYSYNTKDVNVSISLKDFETLCEDWGQDFDKGRGKGSHKVLNFGPHSVDYFKNEIDKQVSTLTNAKNLPAYQIKAHREMFIKFGYYPCYLKDKLIRKGLITE